MTIKILKQGKLPEDIQYAFECYNCKTEFVATNADGKRVQEQREGDYTEVNCPTCGYRCTSQKEYYEHPIDPNKIPDGTYTAILGGYVSKFYVDRLVYRATFIQGVKGFNIKDSITIKDGKAYSQVLKCTALSVVLEILNETNRN